MSNVIIPKAQAGGLLTRDEFYTWEGLGGKLTDPTPWRTT